MVDSILYFKTVVIYLIGFVSFLKPNFISICIYSDFQVSEVQKQCFSTQGALRKTRKSAEITQFYLTMYLVPQQIRKCYIGLVFNFLRILR